MKFGFWVKMVLLQKFIPQSKLTSMLELSADLKPTSLNNSIFWKKSINRSFEFLSVPNLLRSRGSYWIDNVLVPIPSWGVGVTVKKLNWGSQPGGRYAGVSVPWRAAVPVCPAYLSRIPENTRATACCVRDNLLRDHRLARIQSLSDSRNILCDRLVNRKDCAWDDLWDEPVDE